MGRGSRGTWRCSLAIQSHPPRAAHTLSVVQPVRRCGVPMGTAPSGYVAVVGAGGGYEWRGVGVGYRKRAALVAAHRRKTATATTTTTTSRTRRAAPNSSHTVYNNII